MSKQKVLLYRIHLVMSNEQDRGIVKCVNAVDRVLILTLGLELHWGSSFMSMSEEHTSEGNGLSPDTANRARKTGYIT